jgi:anti-sigma factor ChrR (cupin superfamily)
MEHPSEDTLELYYMERLDAVTEEQVAAHLEACEECVMRLEQQGAVVDEIRNVLGGMDQ